MSAARCDDVGGTGLGAGHVCYCMARPGHEPIFSLQRAHGCPCGALWGDVAEEAN